jgi:hypothetical protein
MAKGKKTKSGKITPQAAGAFGEKAVEAELLRHNWIPANVNASVKNAAKFDIYAVNRVNERERQVQIQVKTCRPGMPAFLNGGFQAGKPITAAGISESDFTVVVRMGDKRERDRFYVVPTAVVWTEIGARQREHKVRKHIGMWRLRFKGRRDGRQEAGCDIENKWSQYLDDWQQLDRVSFAG